MLLAYSCDNTYFWMHKIAYFFYVARLFRSHFHDKDLVVRLEILPDCSYHTHCRVVAAGSHHDIIMFRKDTI